LDFLHRLRRTKQWLYRSGIKHNHFITFPLRFASDWREIVLTRATGDADDDKTPVSFAVSEGIHSPYNKDPHDGFIFKTSQADTTNTYTYAIIVGA
jgi:hypothetical protein